MSQPIIVMYVREDCSDVALARSVLESRHIVWTEIDIEKDPDARAKVVEWTGRAATPTIWIGDTMLVEPRTRALLEAIDDSGAPES